MTYVTFRSEEDSCQVVFEIMQREQQLDLLKQNLRNQNLLKHCLAVEAAMGELARYFGEDEEKWATVGLLHDIDYEKSKGDPALHSKIGSEMLKELGFDQEIYEAVLTHNEFHGVEPKTLMAKALFCADPLTGLVVAATLVLPSKKLADLKAVSALKRFKEPAFAKGVNREIIAKCQDYLNLTLEQFVEIVLRAMQAISGDLGL